jgi:hypothetical protein
MEKDIRESIALKRYQIISPVLAEPTRAQNEYFSTSGNRPNVSMTSLVMVAGRSASPP